MVNKLDPKLIEAFDRVRKVYLLKGFEDISVETKDILPSNIKNETYVMDLKSTIELIMESKLEDQLANFHEFFALSDLKEELAFIHSYLLEVLKGDPDVENVKCFIIFNPITGIVKFGWNYQIFKKDIDLVIGLFTAITSFSREAIERQLKGLSVEGLEFQMFPFEKSDLAILFILERNPSPLLKSRLNSFTCEIESQFLDLFTKMDFIDFTDDEKIQQEIDEIMVNILKFDHGKLTKIQESKSNS